MAKITLDNLTSGYASLTSLNDNFDAIETELNSKVLYRDNPSGEPNTMEQELDMNNYSINNVDNIDVVSIVVDGIDITAQVSLAQTYANNASTSATAAASSASAAASSAADAAGYVDTFDDKYLGSKASDPTLDNDGDALTDGALYFNTTDNIMKVYDLGTTSWLSVNISDALAADVTTVAGISSDVTSVADISSNVTTVSGISANVTTVAGNSSYINTVAGIASDVTTVSANSANITTVAGVSSDVTTVAGISSDVSTVATNVTDVTTFATTYLGAQASAPTTSVTGALYYDTSANQLYVWDGAGWNEAAFSVTGAVTSFNTRTGAVTLTSGDVTTALTYTPLDPANNLSDVASVSTARTNLGLGTAATTASTDYATAAQGALADSATQPGDNVSTLTNDSGYLTSTTGVTKTATTGSGVLPSGTTAERDGSPAAGYIRFNSDETSFEGYDGTAWGSIGGGASAGGVIYENTTTISDNYTLTTGTNGMSVGPITIDSGVSVTVPSGQRWVVL